MRQWLREHFQGMQGVANCRHRVVTTSVSADPVDMAIVDDTGVLLLSADGNSVSTQMLKEVEAVDLIRDYYASWWASSETLESYAERTGLMNA